MLTTPIDNMNFKNDQEIKAMLGHEDIYFSDKIIKVRQGIFSSNQERVILITDQALYNLKGKEKKRRIEIGSLSGVTISKLSDQFVIHGKNEEYDYLYSSPNRLKIIEILENTKLCDEFSKNAKRDLYKNRESCVKEVYQLYLQRIQKKNNL